MKKLLFFVWLWNSVSHAQTYFSTHIDLNKDSDVGFQIIEHQQEFYILSGSYCTNNTIPCCGIIKLDKQFHLVWKREFNWFAPQKFTHMVVMDSSIYLAGYMTQVDTLKLGILHLNLNGDSLDLWRYGAGYYEVSCGLARNGTDGLAYLTLPVPNIAQGFYPKIRFLDLQGNVLSEKTYPDTFFTQDPYYFKPTPDGGFTYSSINCLDQTCEYKKKAFAKLDSQGNHVFTTAKQKHFGTYTAPTVAAMPDGGLVFSTNRDTSGFGVFSDPQVITRVDNTGKELWEYVFISEKEKLVFALTVADNGDILGAGRDINHQFTDVDLPDSLYRDLGGWMFRLSPDGQLLWERTIVDTRIPELDFGELYDIIEADDHSIVAIGTIQDTASGFFINNPNVWVVHTDSVGCLWPSCERVEIVLETDDPIESGQSNKQLAIFPNPAIEKVWLALPDDAFFPENTIVSVSNASGQFVEHRKLPAPEKQVELDVRHLPAGIYFLSVVFPNVKRATGKLVLSGQ